MKKLITILLITLSISACNSSKNLTTFVKTHCSEVHSVDLATGNTQIRFECDSLYDSKGVKNVCEKSIVCFDVSQGTLSGELVCGNENTSLKDIFLNLFSKIKFKK